MIKICDYCGKEYYTDDKNRKFCSRECYVKSINDNSKLITKVCPNCGKEFQTYHKQQICCCKECNGEYSRKRIECICDTCGKEFERKVSDVMNSKNHFCCKQCMYDYYSWSESDREILRQYYRKIKTRDLAKMLSKDYNNKNINAEAARLGLTESREWSQEEEQIVKDYYSNIPIKELLKMLPKRSVHSIRRKAGSFNLLSNYYLNRKYTEQEEDYLRINYLNQTNEELAEFLERTPYAIEQKLRILGLNRPIEIKKDGCYKLDLFIRTRIESWKRRVREDNNYTCCITGGRSNIVVHHCRSFNLLMEEAITNLQFEIKDNFEDYTDDELNAFADEFMRLQEEYGEYVCITNEIHVLFHRLYGYGNNTMEQWNEFVNRYNNGEFDKVA